MKSYSKHLLMAATAMVILAGCNKSNTYSNRLMKAGEWTVTELSVDGINEIELPVWEIEDCDIFEESCHGEWKNEEGGHAVFIWQFRDKGKQFEVSRQESEEHEHEHGHATEEANAQCYAFSGIYEVTESKKDQMEFRSTNTLGHPGKPVVIKIRK